MEIRSFLAFELPPKIRETLSAVSRDARTLPLSVRWVRIVNIHLTVVFMGSVQEDQIGSIAEAARHVCHGYAPFRIHLKGAGVFGSRRNPRVLWVGLEGDMDRMSVLRDDLQKNLAPFGIEEENRPFRPHLTLGRFRKGAKADPSLDDLLLKYQDLNGPECLVSELVLFKSDLSSSGAVYTSLGKWPLSG
jgi:2'-5' RNA ligase